MYAATDKQLADLVLVEFACCDARLMFLLQCHVCDRRALYAIPCDIPEHDISPKRDAVFFTCAACGVERWQRIIDEVDSYVRFAGEGMERDGKSY